LTPVAKWKNIYFSQNASYGAQNDELGQLIILDKYLSRQKLTQHFFEGFKLSDYLKNIFIEAPKIKDELLA